MSLSHKSISPDSSFIQNRILTKTLFSMQFMSFLFNYHHSFLDNVERIGVVSLIEDDLTFFVGFGQATTCQCVFLILSQVFEEREDL